MSWRARPKETLKMRKELEFGDARLHYNLDDLIVLCRVLSLCYCEFFMNLLGSYSWPPWEATLRHHSNQLAPTSPSLQKPKSLAAEHFAFLWRFLVCVTVKVLVTQKLGDGCFSVVPPNSPNTRLPLADFLSCCGLIGSRAYLVPSWNYR